MGLLMYRYRITDKYYSDMMREQADKGGPSEKSLKEAPAV